MPKEIKDMTKEELVCEFNAAAMHLHDDFGYATPHTGYAEGWRNFKRHTALKEELLKRLSSSDDNISHDKAQRLTRKVDL